MGPVSGILGFSVNALVLLIDGEFAESVIVRVLVALYLDPSWVRSQTSQKRSGATSDSTFEAF